MTGEKLNGSAVDDVWYMLAYPVCQEIARLSLCVHRTCPKVGVLLRCMLALVNPFTVALEEDLESGPSLTPELDGVILDNVRINRLLEEVRQCPRLAMLQGFTSGPCGMK